MCVEESVSKEIREGILIDAPFPQNMLLADKILQKEGFRTKDYINIQTQYEEQYSELRYIKSIAEVGANGQYTEDKLKCFVLTVPDRYVPVSIKERKPKKQQEQGNDEEEKNVIIIKDDNDINTLYSEKEESK